MRPDAGAIGSVCQGNRVGRIEGLIEIVCWRIILNTHFKHNHVALVSLIAFLIVMTHLLSSVLATTASAQGWKSGQANWNGSGYQYPPTPAPMVAPETASSMLALPTNQVPSINELPDEWTAEFGLSESSLDLPVLESPTMSPPVLGQASAKVPVEPLPLTDGAVGSGTYDGSMPMGNAIADGETFDHPPLEEEVVQWYQVPWRWISKGWENHAEFGLDGSSGNADTLAIQTGLEMKRKTKKYTFALDFDYRQASASNVTTEDNGRLNLDYDRLFNDSPWTLFGKFGMEFDEFKSFDLRLNMNGGLGYYWIRNDKTNIVTRFGAGASKEIGSPDDDWVPEAVFGFEADHQLSARQKVKAKIDYFPAWDDFSNYRLVTDLAWETLIDSSENLSLRLSLTDRYDSTPQGAKPNDFYYSALLLYKF